MNSTIEANKKRPRKLLTALGIFVPFAIVAGVIGMTLSKAAPSAVYSKGLAAAHEQDWPTVEECADQLAGNPEFASHRSILQGFVALSKQRRDQALIHFSKGQSHPDTREESYLQAGSICYALKEYREAIHLLQQVVEWNPDRVDAHRLLAAAQYDIGAMDQALDGLTNVIRLAPDDYRPHHMKGCILQDYEQFQVAASTFEEAADVAGGDISAQTKIRIAWSECLLRLGRHTEAFDVLKTAGDVPEVWVRRAEACYYLRQFQEAHELIERALVELPHDVDAITVAVRLWEQSKDFDRGISLIQPALERDPMNVRLLSSAADVFGAAGRLDEAQSFREKAAEVGTLQHRFSQLHQDAVKDVNNAKLRVELGQVAEQLGKLQIAQTWFQAAMGMAPDDEFVRKEWEQFRNSHPEVH